MTPARSPWSSACWPSVAETVLWLSSWRLIGSAPMRRNSARSCAELIVKSPEICAPVRPSIPVGFSEKLMIGSVTTWPSSTTEKCWEYASACAPATPGGAVAAPRSRDRPG